MEISTQVEMKGPLFKGNVPQKLRKTVTNAIEEAVQVGESYLVEALRPQPAGFYKPAIEAGRNASTGNYRRNLSTRVQNLKGIISDGGVIYGPWLEGISARNRATPFKGYAAFRKATQVIDRKIGRILEVHINKFIGKMNGL